ncbi:hypothetical protein DBR44_00420 [Aquitalea sp. FJL05]|uniref:FRG domain-containing protein n=1 Tax=Aquitalea sp. FJL05 TaxID=2153366 RepID=UPI000F59E643|nr:FRG domain-containing protein [Aquitalea sp. FJL05]RQO78250.1 hypothetical protein DBR44_00420 [Aquitalea sp. FJL05]
MPIIEHNFTDIDEFWKFISPDGEIVNQMGQISYPIFRGQGDASWTLHPAALRKNVIDKYMHERHVYSQTDHVIFFEFDLLSAYIHYSDEMALTIPGDSQQFREDTDFYNFANRFGSIANEWPTNNFYPLLASAQHHGIPTRLLDWSRSPFVAAYFAATQALNFDINEKEKEIVVWAADVNKIDRLKHETDESITQIEFLSLPGVTSKNLAAQKGCFILLKWIMGQSRDNRFNPGTSIEQILSDNKEINLYKITLPHKQVGELLLKCKKYGFSAATLFPGSDGAGRAATEFKLAKLRADRM